MLHNFFPLRNITVFATDFNNESFSGIYINPKGGSAIFNQIFLHLDGQNILYNKAVS